MKRKSVVEASILAALLCASVYIGGVDGAERPCMQDVQAPTEGQAVPHVVPNKSGTERKEAPTDPDPADMDMLISCDELEELAFCVEAEAGTQSLLGKRLVVDVILNRVDDRDWPDTVSGVIEQPYQFASFWDGGMGRVDKPSGETYEAIRMEMEARSYPGIYYFNSEHYSEYGTPWKKIEEHYFSKK